MQQQQSCKTCEAKLTKFEREIDKFTRKDFNTPLSTIDRNSRQKISEKNSTTPSSNHI